MKRDLTNEELLDRYIHAVKLRLMLPPDKMEDIGAEVQSHLESQIEEQSLELGRELRADEVSEILKRHGHPAKVALQYREQPTRGLISAALFPFYWFTLRAALALWLTIRLIILVFAFQGTTTTGTLLLLLGRDVLVAGFIIAAGVTLLFAGWEYLEFKYRYSERWKPEALGAVPRPGTRPARAGSTVAIATASASETPAARITLPIARSIRSAEPASRSCPASTTRPSAVRSTA